MKFADIFAGIGGFHIAAQRLGLECVYACEIDKFARKTYEANFSVPRFDTDISNVNHWDLPEFDLLMAGFPCQPFSQVGLRQGMRDPRADTIRSLLSIIRGKKPPCILLENVRGLLSTDHGKAFEALLCGLRSYGYKVYWKLLKACDYGLPTFRPRIYIVGFLDPSIDFKFPEPVALKFTLSDLFGNQCQREIGYTLRARGRNSGVKNRQNHDTYIVDGKEHRITVDEAKKLMGFPEDFIFPVSNTQIWKQLGNSVAVDTVYHVLKSIISVL